MKKDIINLNNITNQEKLILLISFLFLVILATFILKNIFDDNRNIDYKKQTIEDLYNEAFINNDRQTYWILDSIISSFITSYQLELTDNNTEKSIYKREDFYQVLSNDYKKVLSKRKYLEKSKEMCNKFIVGSGNVKKNDFIEEVRQLDQRKYLSNMYIVKLKTVLKDSKSYIGIKIIPDTRNYSIFYLE